MIFADDIYVARWGHLFDDAAKGFLNSLIKEGPRSRAELVHLGESLARNELDARAYLDDLFSCFMRRYLGEYRYFLDLNVQLFPYCLLCDHAGTALPPRDFGRTECTIEFLYPISGDALRRRASINSLIRAIEHYRSRNALPFLFPSISFVQISDDPELCTDDLVASACALRQSALERSAARDWGHALDVGLRQSRADMVSFVEDDFIFHERFLDGLDSLFLSTDLERHIYAVNVVEAESHERNEAIHSRGSPAGYFWMANRRAILDALSFKKKNGADHLSLDDLVRRLTDLCGLAITDSISNVPSAVVFRLPPLDPPASEPVPSAAVPSDAKQVVSSVDLSLGESERDQETMCFVSSAYRALERRVEQYDFLLIAHNKYHAETLLDLRTKLMAAGRSAVLLDIRGYIADEGAYLPGSAMAYVSLEQLLKGWCVFRCLVCMNDWEGKVAARLVEFANAQGIPTVAIVEGVNDFLDVDTKRKRRAYRRVRHVLLNGDFDRRYFEGTDQQLSICGLQRLDRLLEARGMVDPTTVSRERRIVVNVNFTYRVLETHRAAWLEDIHAVAGELGLQTIHSVHHAETVQLGEDLVSKESLYDLLKRCEIFISRFSGAILEALVLGANVIYYNPGFEKVDKFTDPMDGYWFARSKTELRAAIEEISRGVRKDPSRFLHSHADVDPDRFGEPTMYGSVEKTRDVLIRCLDAQRPARALDTNALKAALPWFDDLGVQESR